MKNRKRIITTLIGMTLTTQLSPVGCTIVNAQEVSGVAQTDNQQQQNKLSKNVISLKGIGCEEKSTNGKPDDHEVRISFNTQNNTFNVEIISGTYGEEHPFHPYFGGQYIRIALISENGKVKQDFSLSGNENIRKLEDELNKWKFKYGDRLRISHEEAGGRTTITGNVSREESNKVNSIKDVTNADKGISKADLDNYDFKITPDGLVEVEKDIVEVNDSTEFVEALKALKDSDNNNDKRIIKLKKSITFTDQAGFTEIANNSKKMELVVPEGVTITGDPSKNIEINFNNNGSLTLKGGFTRLEFVTIRGCDNTGIHIYDSNSYLRRVTVEGSQGYAMFANGSNVKLENCTTKNNRDGGILVSTSLELINRKGKNSTVEVVDVLNQQEDKKPNVVIKNLKLDELKINQNNTFKGARGNYYAGLKPQNYEISSKKESEKELNAYYSKLLGLHEGTKFTEKILSYKLVQK